MCASKEPQCDISGRCQAASGDRGISNCIHCGKELCESDGFWWTWDANFYSDPKPQCPVR